MKRDKVVSVRVSEELEKEILNIMWWDNYTTKTEALRVILKLGIQTWKHKKCLNPFKCVYVEKSRIKLLKRKQPSFTLR